MKNSSAFVCFSVFCMILTAGCAGVISRGLQDQAAANLSFDDVFAAPEAHTGKVVVWGGTIVSTRNLKEGTVIEVVRKELDFSKRPKDVDRSSGRFLAHSPEYLDSAIYSEGREITVAGEITGKRVQRLDEIEYVYPVVEMKEHHLWEERMKDPAPYYPGRSWYYWHPYYSWSPWYW